MSLIKQLWIAIAVLMAATFVGSTLVSVLSARHYLEQQLQVKNIDNATALALSLSQMEKDPVTVELQVAAQFDAGHYQFIRIVSPKGEKIVEKVSSAGIDGAPEWFVSLVPIRSQPGQALIQDGWKQFGTVALASQKNYAYRSLWEGTLDMLLWFLLGSAAAAVAGTFFVRLITRPLLAVVDQAQAIADRRFLTIPEPRTPELRAVVKAMNDMVERIKGMFAEEAARLEGLRRKINRDEVTGLSTREYFMSHLRETVMGDQFGSAGSLVMLRLMDLNELNKRLGRQQADALLKAVGTTLYNSGNGRVGQRAGRVKGAEFAIICPTFDTAEAAALDIHQRLQAELMPGWADRVPELYHLSAVRYRREQNIGSLLAAADEALAKAAAKGPNSWHAVEDGATARPAISGDQWRTLLGEAAAGSGSGGLTLNFFPVVKGDGSAPLHREGVIRLNLGADGTVLPAGDFMPMAAQLNLTAPIDLRVVRLAIEQLKAGAGDIAVNLSAETVADLNFRSELTQLLKTHPDAARRLLFEVPEYGVFRHLDAFRELARQLKALGARVGIEYFGQRFAEGDKLADLGLDYIKVHPSYVRGIGGNAGNQEFLRGLCKVAHAMGITVVALGVESRDDLPMLASLGFDGVTGPGVN